MRSPRTPATIGLLFSVSLVYAATRYALFKGVPLAHFPVYVVNKAVAMTALALLGVSAASRAPAVRRAWGRAGLAASGLHVLLSLTILTPAYFPRLFDATSGAGPLSLSGELFLLSGAAALWALAVVAWPRRTPAQPTWGAAIPWIANMALLGIAAHCLLRGWAGWWRPASWPGGLPPISLLAFLYATATAAIGVARSRPPRTTDRRSGAGERGGPAPGSD